MIAHKYFILNGICVQHLEEWLLTKCVQYNTPMSIKFALVCMFSGYHTNSYSKSASNVNISGTSCIIIFHVLQLLMCVWEDQSMNTAFQPDMSQKIIS